jgi:hypothetical protein
MGDVVFCSMCGILWEIMWQNIQKIYAKAQLAFSPLKYQYHERLCYSGMAPAKWHWAMRPAPVMGCNKHLGALENAACGKSVAVMRGTNSKWIYRYYYDIARPKLCVNSFSGLRQRHSYKLVETRQFSRWSIQNEVASNRVSENVWWRAVSGAVADRSRRSR